MNRAFNFSAGPATLPVSVLHQAAEEMLDWHGCGLSVMEMSHRSTHFTSIHQQALDDLRELLHVPDNYEILFMQGGAIAENAIIPMNLIGRLDATQPKADYLVTGAWSEKSRQEATKYGAVNLVASSQNNGFTDLPELSDWCISDDAAYLHLCTNETIHGVEFHELPNLGQHPILVADMSSHLLSRPIDVSRYGVIYAGAQKNIGIAGLTIVIARQDLLGFALPCTPSAFNWKIVAEAQSMYNTPPTYAIYIAGLVFKWLKEQGGLSVIEERNIAKAKLLYQTIDSSSFYYNSVSVSARSRMNIPFFLANHEHEQAFLLGAEKNGLLQLKGHKTIGGIRASLYNTMPIAGVHALVDYMKHFEQRHA